MNKIVEFIRHPIKKIKIKSESRFVYKNKDLPDEEYLKAFYKRVFHEPLDLNEPKTFNQKLQYLKLYDRKELYTTLVDKYAVREYVKEKIGEEYLVPLCGVWDNPESIDFEKLPNKFVLKCTHNSGRGMFICKDKKNIDKKRVIDGLYWGLAEDFYSRGREWPYKNVPKRIICEKFLEDGSGVELMDYKLFCFDGKFKVLLICSDRHTRLSNDWYDENLVHLPCINGPKNRKKKIVISNQINKMIELAEKLSIGIPQARIDFYDVNGQIYFGEITLFESSGLSPFKPKEYDEIFGSYIRLPEKKIQ